VTKAIATIRFLKTVESSGLYCPGFWTYLLFEGKYNRGFEVSTAVTDAAKYFFATIFSC
jgi:hypothetical protein